MKRSKVPIVGPDVRSQSNLRPPKPVRDLDEFLEFLQRLEEVFGRAERPPERTTGDHFLL